MSNNSENSENTHLKFSRVQGDVLKCFVQLL